MPRPCAVVVTLAASHPRLSDLDATGLPRGDSRLFACRACKLLASSNVRLHGTSPWHLKTLWSANRSCKRESPRRKAVASMANFARVSEAYRTFGCAVSSSLILMDLQHARGRIV